MKTQKEPVKLGFVGVGNMGQMAHLRNYAILADCQVLALAEPRPDLARRVAARYNIPHVYADAGAMLAAHPLEALVAPQPFDRHGQLITPLYECGLPLLTEKPLAASPEVARQLLEALSRSNSRHVVGYHKRSDHATVYAREQIESWQKSREMGRMTYIRATMPAGDWVAGGFNELLTSPEGVPAMAADPAPATLTAQEQEEYVQFVNFYIHQVNLLRHLLGEPYNVTHADPAGVLLVGKSRGGVPVSLEMSPYRTTRAWQESYLICFERGWILLELPAPVALNRPGKVTVFADPGDGRAPVTLVPELPWEHAMLCQAKNFLRLVRGEDTPLCLAQEAGEDLLIAKQYLEQKWEGTRA